MTGGQIFRRWREDRLRREAAAWFARLRAPDGARSRAAFEAWRGADQRRARIYARLERHWDAAEALKRAPASQVRGAGTAHARSKRLGWGLGLAAATPIAIALMLLIAPPRVMLDLAWLGQPREATRVGEIRSLRLPDGSSAILDTDTILATRFTATERRLRLVRGRARFDVAPDLRRPFVVDLGSDTFVSGGSLFDVRVSDDESVGAAPLRGSLLIVRRHPRLTRQADAGETRLGPGQSIDLNARGDTSRAGAALTSDTLWPQGFLSFRSTPLASAVEAANRYSQHKILLAGADIGSLQVSGVFRATDTDELASSLAAMFSLHLERRSDGALALSRRAES